MRIKWIDYGKGIAVFLVIIGHVALGTLETGRFSGNDVTVLHYLLELTYFIHIPLFFALSGYFFKRQSDLRGVVGRSARRLVSLGLPYILFSIVMVVLKQLGGAYVRERASIKTLLGIFVTPIDYLWFLYALFFVDLLVSILQLLFKSRSVVMLILLAGFILQTEWPVGLPLVSQTLLWAPFFYLGFLLRRNYIPKKLAWFFAVLCLVHVPIFCLTNPSSQYLYGYWRIFSVFGVIAAFYFLQNLDVKVLPWLLWCGQGSLVIYLIHAPVLSVVRILMFRLGVNALLPQVFLQMFAGFSLSLIALMIVDRVPLLHYLFFPLQKMKNK